MERTHKGSFARSTYWMNCPLNSEVDLLAVGRLLQSWISLMTKLPCFPLRVKFSVHNFRDIKSQANWWMLSPFKAVYHFLVTCQQAFIRPQRKKFPCVARFSPEPGKANRRSKNFQRSYLGGSYKKKNKASSTFLTWIGKQRAHTFVGVCMIAKK